MQEALVTVVVPIYNTEKYLNRCVGSIVNQTYRNLEIILVDDGSPDNCPNMCDEWALVDERIKVIHKENAGLSMARNTGIEAATGEYICFVDSDDYIEQGAFSAITETIDKEKPDVIVGYNFPSSAYVGRQRHDSIKKNPEQCISGVTFYSTAFYQRRLARGAPFYIAKRELIQDNSLSFENGIYHEDELWTPILLYHARKIVTLNRKYYHYSSDNQNSITRDPGKAEKRAKDRLYVAICLAEFFADKTTSADAAFHDNISAQYMYAVYSGSLYNKQKIDRFFPIREARTFIYRAKAILFALSPRIACMLRRFK